MNKVYGVVFKDGSKTYFFKGNDSYEKDDYVVVDTEKGLQYAKVCQIYNDKIAEDSLKEIISLLCVPLREAERNDWKYENNEKN